LSFRILRQPLPYSDAIQRPRAAPNSLPLAHIRKAPAALATGARYHRTEFEQGPFGVGSPNVTLVELAPLPSAGRRYRAGNRLYKRAFEFSETTGSSTITCISATSLTIPVRRLVAPGSHARTARLGRAGKPPCCPSSGRACKWADNATTSGVLPTSTTIGFPRSCTRALFRPRHA
jgi:hypothetical protein